MTPEWPMIDSHNSIQFYNDTRSHVSNNILSEVMHIKNACTVWPQMSALQKISP